MSELYVPPPGTLQFDLLRSATGGPSKYSPIWVYPAQPAEDLPIQDGHTYPGCACTTRYQVVRSSLPDWVQDLVAPEFNVVVCHCRGRVIE